MVHELAEIFTKEEQKKLIKMLNMYRDSCNVLICCVPNFYDLDKQFRSLVKIRINIVRRGLGVLHVPTQSAYCSDPWDLRINEKIERKWLQKNVFKPNYKRLSTYRGMIAFNDLTPNQREIYEQIKQEKRQHLISEDDLSEEKKERIWLEKFLDKVNKILVSQIK